MKKTATSSAHSKSPWRVSTREAMSYRYGKQLEYYVFNNKADDIAVIPMASMFSANNEQAKANVQLIAAAPDILRALNRAVKDLCFLQRCTKISRQETIDACEAAIAKAEGRTFCP